MSFLNLKWQKELLVGNSILQWSIKFSINQGHFHLIVSIFYLSDMDSNAQKKLISTFSVPKSQSYIIYKFDIGKLIKGGNEQKHSHRSSYPCADMGVLVFIQLSQAKVGYLSIQILIKQHICCLYISMNNFQS